MKKLLCIGFLFLNSCIGIIAYSTNKLKTGQTSEEVIKNLGKPLEKKSLNNIEYYVYFTHNNLFDFFTSEKPPYIGFYPLIRSGKEYWVLLQNDIVIGFGNAKNFKHSIKNDVVEFSYKKDKNKHIEEKSSKEEDDKEKNSKN